MNRNSSIPSPILTHSPAPDKDVFMARILKPQTNHLASSSLLDPYADWLDQNFKNVFLWSLWFLFMGVWCALPTISAIKHGGNYSTAVRVMGAHDTSFAAPLYLIGVLTVVSLLLGAILLTSCLAMRGGWLKRQV